MRRPVQVLLWLVAMAPFSAMALGLGNIKLNSALNQPLDAEIELVSATAAELDSLRISLASADAFASYGLDRPAFLTGMRFSVVRDQGARSFVRVRTAQPVREPFVTFLVEADWARGRLLREYTVLLDPPVFMSEQAAPARSEPRPATGVATQAPTGAVAREPEPAPARPTAPAPAPAPVRSQPAQDGMSLRYGPIRRNETLWTISSRLRPEQGITINQMMIALYRENPEAFMGNINLLRQGAVLRVPSTQDIYALSANEAFREVRNQNAAWRGSRPAAASRPVTSRAGTDASGGRATTGSGQTGRLRLVPPGDAARTSAASDSGTPELSDAELAGNAALSERIRGLETELENAQRLIGIKDSELATLQARLEALEARLAAEDTAATPDVGAPGTLGETLPVEPEDTTAVETAPEAVPETPAVVDATPDRVVTQPVEPPAVVVSRPPEQPGIFSKLFDFILGAWMWILGLLVLAIAGVAALFLRKRSKDEDYAESWETGEWKSPEAVAAAQPAMPAEPDTESQPVPKFDRDESFVVEEAEDTISEEALRPDEADELAAALGDAFEDTGTFTPGELEVEKAEQAEALGDDGTAEYPFEDTMIGHDALKLDESDPLAEADFHMAYGLYDQAAALVEGAASKEPDRRDLKMKLLEIFFVWGNKDRFLEEAGAFKASLGDNEAGDWEKVVIMGQQLCPGESLFAAGDATAMSAMPDLELGFGDDEATATATDLDFLGDDQAAADDDDLLGFDLTEAADEASEEEAAAGAELDALKEKIESQLEPSEETLDLGSTNLDIDLEGEDDQGLVDTGISVMPESGDTDMTAALSGSDAIADEDMDIDLDFEFEDVSDDEPTVVMEDADNEDIAAALIPPEDDDDTRIADFSGAGQDDETVLAESADFDPFSADDDKTVQAAQVEDEDHGATMQMQKPDLAADESGELTKLLPEMDDESLGEGTRQMERPEFGGDETVQISRTGHDPDAADTMRIDLGDFESDKTTQIPVADDVADKDDDDLEEATQKLRAIELPEEEDMDEVGTKLDLAKAFVDMGDPEGARNILDEVLHEGNESQKQEARSLLESLG